MKGWFIRNYYYNDLGTDYIFYRLKECLKVFDISLEERKEVLSYDFSCENDFSALPNFVIFWDKDIKLCRALERKGVRVFNSASAIENCDDKERTYAAISGLKIPVPKTICAPLAYNNVSINEINFIAKLIECLDFPMIAKENCGSQGKQVYLLENKSQLQDFYKKMYFVPHHYQHFYKESSGRDYRLYVVNGEVIAVCERENTTDFKANISMGGKMSIINPSNIKELKTTAEIIAKKLNLDYGSIDFLALKDKQVFLEANSNAYFKTIETLGVDIAGKYARHIANVVKGE